MNNPRDLEEPPESWWGNEFDGEDAVRCEHCEKLGCLCDCEQDAEDMGDFAGVMPDSEDYEYACASAESNYINNVLGRGEM